MLALLKSKLVLLAPASSLVAGEARIEARRHQVLIAHQFGAERPQRHAQIEPIDEALREPGVAREIGQHLFALRLGGARAVEQVFQIFARSEIARLLRHLVHR